MEQILGFFLPFLLSISPIIYVVVFGIRRMELGKGYPLIAVGAISLGIGLFAPIIAMITSIGFLSVLNQNPDDPRCYTFVVGFIGIGAMVEIIVFLFILTLIILDKVKKFRR